MNKFKVTASLSAVITFIILFAFTPANAHISEASESAYVAPTPTYSVELIKDRLNNLSGVIDIEYTHEVGRRIKEYTVDYRISGEKILGKVDIFFPIFDQQINEKNLPQELKYIAVVESNLDPKARSKSGAEGLWQFIKSTGRMQNLQIDQYIDERRDPVKSTGAALDYLEYLHGKFGNWTLAMAAYNCGPGNVRKAIRRGKSKDYWEIRKFLPRETQKYVPRIIAAMYLMQYYHEHNLVPRVIDEDMKFTMEINDGQKHSFKKLAADLDVEYDLLRELNPQFKTSYFPSNDGRWTLIIPVSANEKYMKNYAPISYAKMIEEKKREKELAELKIIEAQMLLKKENIDPINRIQGLIVKELYSEERETINISL